MELLVEQSPTAGGFAEVAGTELCKGNVEEIADVERNCTGTYPFAMVCEIVLVSHWQFNALMSLALQHSTYAAIYDLIARAMFLKAAVLLLFISEISPSDSRGKLSLVYCHCSYFDFVEQDEDFREKKYQRTVQWYFSQVDVYPRLPRLWRSDIKQWYGGLNCI